jgi:uncharacterized protein (DUF983 family)
MYSNARSHLGDLNVDSQNSIYGDRQMEDNQNWGTCPKCGEPVLLDPKTGQAEPCATCASLASKSAGSAGMALLIAGVVALIGLVYFCVSIL